MRILQLVKYYYPSKGGIETVVENIVNGIYSISNDVYFTIYTNSHFKCSKDIEIYHNNHLIFTKAVKFFFKNQPIIFYFKELRNLILNHDVIHLHYPYPNIELSLIFMLSIFKRKKLVITWHANIEKSRWGFLSLIYNFFIRFLLQNANTIIITSPSLLSNSKLLLKFKSKVVVIPLSISSNFENLIGIERKPNEPFNLLFVGRLRKYKGVDVLINSIKNLNVKLIIVGEGAEFFSLYNLVKALNLTDKVIFKKGLTDLELIDEYKNADLFVLPSINEAEAFGIVQLEAMSFGLPVINTKLNSGVPFVSIDNFTGITVTPNNVEDLTKAIEKIFSSLDLYESFSKNAFLRSRDFSNEKLALSYLNIYNS
jgi:glycosyltransferase involved in cell wall biosynthesis